jgi:Leucine rich repeat
MNLLCIIIISFTVFFVSSCLADIWPDSTVSYKSHRRGRNNKRLAVDYTPVVYDACDRCSCYVRKSKQYVDCTTTLINAIPSNIPLNTSRLWLQSQLIPDIGYTQFLPQLPYLRELLLHGNPITKIHVDAFQNVTTIRLLLLHYTQITELPGDVFSKLSKLKILWINDARLNSIPNGTFNGLTK